MSRQAASAAARERARGEQLATHLGRLLPAPGCPRIPAPPELEIPSHEPAPAKPHAVSPHQAQSCPAVPPVRGALEGQRSDTVRWGHCGARHREHGGN